MVVPGAFPIVKLGALAVRQIAKPLANVIKSRAKSSPFFRTYVCMPPAQFYHWCEVNVKMRMLNLGKPREVKKLDQNAAIELGAELLGEFVMFTVAAVTLTAEYVRQSRKATKEAEELEARWVSVENRLSEIEYVTTKQSDDIRELTRLVYGSGGSPKPPNPSGSSSSPPEAAKGLKNVIITKGAISNAIEEAKDKITNRKSSS